MMDNHPSFKRRSVNLSIPQSEMTVKDSSSLVIADKRRHRNRLSVHEMSSLILSPEPVPLNPNLASDAIMEAIQRSNSSRAHSVIACPHDSHSETESGRSADNSPSNRSQTKLPPTTRGQRSSGFSLRYLLCCITDRSLDAQPRGGREFRKQKNKIRGPEGKIFAKKSKSKKKGAVQHPILPTSGEQANGIGDGSRPSDSDPPVLVCNINLPSIKPRPASYPNVVDRLPYVSTSQSPVPCSGPGPSLPHVKSGPSDFNGPRLSGDDNETSIEPLCTDRHDGPSPVVGVVPYSYGDASLSDALELGPGAMYLLGEPSKDCIGKKCLVLDLDETLVHSWFRATETADFVVPVDIDGSIHQIFVCKRPHLESFLNAIGPLFECVMFTASLRKYADPVCDFIDTKDYFRHRLFREDCVSHQNNLIKDLSRLGRDIDKVCILDNSPVSFLFQPNNALQIVSWFDDPNDTALLDLIPYFIALSKSENVVAFLRDNEPPKSAGVAQPAIPSWLLMRQEDGYMPDEYGDEDDEAYDYTEDDAVLSPSSQSLGRQNNFIPVGTSSRRAMANYERISPPLSGAVSSYPVMSLVHQVHQQQPVPRSGD